MGNSLALREAAARTVRNAKNAQAAKQASSITDVGCRFLLLLDSMLPSLVPYSILRRLSGHIGPTADCPNGDRAHMALPPSLITQLGVSTLRTSSVVSVPHYFLRRALSAVR